MRVLMSSLSLITALAFVGACTSSTDTGDGGSGPSSGSEGGTMPSGPYDGGDPSTLMMPMRSFQNDIIPIFENSCDFSGCHINPGGMPLEFLGPQKADMTPVSQYKDSVYMGIVNKPTIEDPQMVFVKPGDPTNSYMMRKLDNALTDITCTANNALFTQYQAQDSLTIACGNFMPITNTAVLDQSVRDTVREWIAQGALNN